MNIICLYWEGDFRGRDFNLNDISRLYDSVVAHIDRSFNFYCLTNVPEKVSTIATPIELLHDFPGWWAKIELHSDRMPEGRCLYLDLDSHVIRNLNPILDYEGDLVMFNSRAAAGAGVVKRYQAATMLFDSNTKVMHDVYREFICNADELMKRYRSEQDIMGDWIPNQPTFPDSWMMKLSQARGMEVPPEDCIIVTGQPPDNLFRRTEEIPWLEPMRRGESYV